MIEFARWDMRQALSVLWQECFHDPKKYPDYFMNNIFSPDDCLVYCVGSEPAAAVYFLPAQILAGESAMQAHYIFAAATAPRFRCRGYMSSLLAYAAHVGSARGDCFSAVLPSDESLYRFYAAFGYQDFFRVRLADVSAVRLKPMACPGSLPGKFLPDVCSLNSLRKKCLAGNSGSMLWDDRMFHLSIGMSCIYGDRLIYAGQAEKPAYALCCRQGKECTVLETAAEADTFPELAAAILREMPAARYRFRLPEKSGLFCGEGESVRFGMLKPLGGRVFSDLAPNYPYLGLTMD